MPHNFILKKFQRDPNIPILRMVLSTFAFFLSPPLRLYKPFLSTPSFFHFFVSPISSSAFLSSKQVIACHCKFHKTYRRFTTRQPQLIPIFGFGRRSKQKNGRHWLSGKGNLSTSNKTSSTTALNQTGTNGTKPTDTAPPNAVPNGMLNTSVPPFQRHLAMNLENDMYYTCDFSESQHSPLIH